MTVPPRPSSPKLPVLRMASIASIAISAFIGCAMMFSGSEHWPHEYLLTVAGAILVGSAVVSLAILARVDPPRQDGP